MFTEEVSLPDGLSSFLGGVGAEHHHQHHDQSDHSGEVDDDNGCEYKDDKEAQQRFTADSRLRHRRKCLRIASKN